VEKSNLISQRTVKQIVKERRTRPRNNLFLALCCRPCGRDTEWKGPSHHSVLLGSNIQALQTFKWPERHFTHTFRKATKHIQDFSGRAGSM